MHDIRQGPLSIRNDPLSTTAERCTVTRPMSEAEISRYLDALAAPIDRPALTAFRGFNGGGVPHYYKSITGWRDTLTEAPWGGPPRNRVGGN